MNKEPILREISMTSKRFHCYVRRRCEQIGIPSSYHPIIMCLSRNGEMSQQELVDKLHLSKPTISLTLQKMEQDGYIKRVQSSMDARITNVSLTAEGKKIDELIKEVFNEVENKVFEILGEKKDNFLNLLHDINDAIESVDLNEKES